MRAARSNKQEKNPPLHQQPPPRRSDVDAIHLTETVDAPLRRIHNMQGEQQEKKIVQKMQHYARRCRALHVNEVGSRQVSFPGVAVALSLAALIFSIQVDRGPRTMPMT